MLSFESAVEETEKIGHMVVDRLYRDWLPASGYQADDKPRLEIYHDTRKQGQKDHHGLLPPG